MKRVIALTATAGLLFAACGGSDEAVSNVDEVVDEVVAEVVAETEAPADTEAPAEDEAPAAGLSVDTINVAYFEQWPTPNLTGFDDGSFDAAVGATINWVPFGGGGEMSEAMAAGDIDISYSQGLTP
ncbi:MAG: hypothetical protein ACI9ME_001528, partial [Ilumatobacter sp.]